MRIALWRILCLPILVLLAAPLCNSQSASTPPWAGKIDAIAEKALTQPVAGISIAVAKNGMIVFRRGYGFANVEHSVPVKPETVFHIASISKNIEAGVALQLVDLGKMHLEDDLTRYVPLAPVQGKHVTVQQLLSQTSGIYSFTSLPNAAQKEPLDLTHEQVLDLIRDKPFDFEPGSSWRYDNSGFYLGGMVIEKAVGSDYASYAKDHVFQPLGMTSSQLCDSHMLVPHLASGYERADGHLIPAELMSWKLPFAAGAVCATATDLLKWEMALDAGRVLTPASLNFMRTPTRLSDGTSIDYGLGTRLGFFHGRRVFGHTGTGGGFSTVLESFPDDRLTIAVLINTADGHAISIAANVARAILGIPAPELSDLPVPEDELKAIPGTYDSDEGPVELFVKDGKIHFRIPGALPDGGAIPRQGKLTYAIDRDHEVKFLVRNGRAEWGFEYAAGLLLDAKVRQTEKH